MDGTLGEKIGEGEFSDVHAWAPGQVVKLYKIGRSQRLARHEAAMTQAAFAAGAPAPQVLGEVMLNGRFGIVMARLDGETLVQLRRTGALTTQQAGATLAALAMMVHRTPPPSTILCLRDWMYHSLKGAGDRIPGPIATGVRPLVERLVPRGHDQGGLCHGDLHPGNVIVTADGPRLIDWQGAMRAPAALDFAVSHFLLTEIAPDRVEDPARPPAINLAMQTEYARLAGISHAALLAALEQFLPVVWVFVLLGDVFPAKRQQLIRRVEAALDGLD